MAFKPSAIGRAYAQPKYSRPKRKPRKIPPAFGGPLPRAFAPQQKQARKKVQRTRARLPQTPRPAIPELRAPTPTQRRTATRLRERSVQIERKKQRRVARRQETRRVRRQVLRQARATERYYSSAGRRAARIAGPPTPSYATRLASVRAMQLRAGQQSMSRAHVDRRRFLPDVETRGAGPDPDAKTLPELQKDIRYLRLSPTEQLKRDPRRFQKTIPEFDKADLAAIKVLNQTTRPIHAIAAGSKAALKGENVAQAAWKGAKLQDKTLFSDVLKQAGVPSLSGARSVAGFLLDVGLDPTTYLTLGTTTAARQAALKASEKAAKSAADTTARRIIGDAQRKGTSVSKSEVKREAREAGRQAARRVLDRSKRSQRGKGVEVKLAGRTVPLVRPATSALGQVAGKAARPVTERTKGARGVTRQALSEKFAPVRSTTVSAQEETLSKALRRETRATGESRVREINQRVNALLGSLSKHEHDLVIDAIEAGRLSSLRGTAAPLARSKRSVRPRRGKDLRSLRKDPDRLYEVAKRVDADLKYLRRTGRRSGLLAGDIGLTSRSRREVEHAAAATAPVRSTTKLRSELTKAETSFAKARDDLRTATTPRAKAGARARVRSTGQRVTNLRRQIGGVEQTAARRETAQGEIRQIRERRRGEEARGYFPRVRSDAVRSRSLLERANEPSIGTVPSIGANRPTAGAARLRQHRKTRAELRSSEKTEHVVEPLTGDIRETLASYGRAIGTASAARELNTKLVQQAGRKLPANLDSAGIKALKENGERIYRVRRGVLEDVTDSPALLKKVSTKREPMMPKGGLGPYAARPAKDETKIASTATEAGGQYRVIRQDVVERVRERAPSQSLAPTAAAIFDRYRAGFKKLALMTPAYLVRNALGDLANAFGDEAAIRLARNYFKGQKILNELGRYEKAQGRFYANIPDGSKTIKLNEKQASEVQRAFGPAGHKRAAPQGVAPPKEISAMQVARLAEQMGVIRQGRFLELMEEQGKLTRGKGTSVWDNATKRVEDSARIATFLGGLQRGMSAREAAQRSSKIHFDYGDLTAFEKRVLRRIAPFYTFTSRNVPLQAEYLLTRPGKLATLQKAREEGRKATGLPEGYEEGLDPYEARQLGIPIKIGGRTQTVSFGSPFVDLNDIVAGPVGLVEGGLKGGASAAGSAAVQRMLELAGGPEKLIPELVTGYSFFYRDSIEPKAGDGSDQVRAPEWAQWMNKKFPGWGRSVGIVPFVDAEGNETVSWRKKTDYAFRNLEIGPIGSILRSPPFGTEGRNARDMTPTQALLTTAGLRTRDYNAPAAEQTKLYDQRDKLTKQRDRLNRQPHPTQRQANGRPFLINADHPTAQYTKVNEQLSAIESRLDELKKQLTPGGFLNGRPIAPSAPTGGGGLPWGGGASTPSAPSKKKAPASTSRLPW